MQKGDNNDIYTDAGTSMTPPKPKPPPRPEISAPKTTQGTSPQRPIATPPQVPHVKPVFIGAKKGQQVKQMSNDNDDNDEPWQSVSYGRKQKLTGPSKGGKVPLSGPGPRFPTIDLYLLNVGRYDDDKWIDIANRVRDHCKENDIKTTYVRVYPKKFSNDTVNVKLVVAEGDSDKAIGSRIWPEGVSCRYWTKDPPKPRKEFHRERSTSRGRHRSNSTSNRGRSRERRSSINMRRNGRSNSGVRFTDQMTEDYYDAFENSYEPPYNFENQGGRY